MDYSKVIYIPTEKINKISEYTFFDINKPAPVIDSGNWDIEGLKDIKDFIIYKSIYAMVKENVSWENTELYQYMILKLKSGKPAWSCDTLEKCKKRGQYILNLHDDIKNTGRIMLREELKSCSGLKSRNSYRENDCIQVAIGRNGQILFAQNGSHRLCISKILELKTVPAMVCRRHVEWENYRKQIFDFCKKSWNGKTYQTIPHPDFGELESIHGDRRYDLIESNTKLRNVKLVDIGSLFGYICYRAERDGFQCTAVEPTKEFLGVMRKLHSASEMKFRIFDDSIFNLDDKNQEIVVAYNIFHHFLKTEKMYNNLIKFLGELNYKEMFIEFHSSDEKQMVGAYKNFSDIEFAKFIIEHSKDKSSFECIGEENGRKIYKIY